MCIRDSGNIVVDQTDKEVALLLPVTNLTVPMTDFKHPLNQKLKDSGNIAGKPATYQQTAKH